VCGSLQKESGNRTLLERATALAPDGVEIVPFDGLRALPHFDPDLDGESIESVAAWRKALADSDALLIATPEYGFSLPGALKNAIDWVIGSGELERKIVGLTAATVAPYRGRRGLGALKDTLSAVSAVIVGGEPIAKSETFDAEIEALVRAIAERVLSAR
jgi:NAD(P)H-dependent FMN reductase